MVEPFSPKTPQDVLEHCVTMKATLILNDDATPKFCKLHKLSFALKPVVGDELDHLETQGFTKKVPHMWSFKNYDQPIVEDQKPLKD